MDDLYNHTNALIQQTQELFKNLSHGPNREHVEKEIQEKIDTISSNCQKLELLIMKSPVTVRVNAKMRCDQLKYDNRHLQAALTSEQQKRIRQETARLEREQLLNHRFAPNPDATMLEMDYALEQNQAMYRAQRGIDEMLDTGTSTLDSLRSQRMTLKGAHKRIISMANTLGLSSYTIRLIERRGSEDKYILIGGMFLTLVVIILVVVYLM